MARPLRLEFAGALYHVTARGNRRDAIFRDAEDRRRFTVLLGRPGLQCGGIAVYLLRRRAKLPLREVAELAGVSAARVSQIQAEVERAAPEERLANFWRL